MITSIHGTQSNNVATWLRELSELEAGQAKPLRGSAAARVNSLRELIPTSILLHYDRLKARGKRSVAPVKRGVCGSCHLAVPSGSLANLRRTAGSLNVCVNCGAFVYFADEDPINGVAAVVIGTRKKRPSKRGIAPARPRSASGKLRAAK
jgi:predicted  nucleic acid-binding Zn-ribbon protein